jgi:hypothetical protein
VDQLGVVARGVGRDGGGGEAHEVGGAAQLLEPLVALEEGLEGDGRGQRVLLDAGGRDLEDGLMDGVEEVLGPADLAHAVEDVVVDEDSAQDLLLGLDGMGQGPQEVPCRGLRPWGALDGARPETRDLAHRLGPLRVLVL